jgi:thiamine-phosphate diphosphorylase
MILHMVTDRRRLLPTGDERARSAGLEALARAAAAAGIDVVQVREPDLDGGPLAALVARVVAATRGSSTRVVVNERLDVALAAGADGVHLRASSFDAAHARQLAPAGFLVGRSVHSVEEAAAAGTVDYLLAGTLWPTSSKPTGHTCLGPAGLAALVKAASVPVLAIGGVELDRVPDVARAGAAGVAAIGAWLPDECEGVHQGLEERTRAFRTAFGAVNMAV